MGGTTFDWRWIIVIVIALMFFGQLQISPSPMVGVVLLALGGYWAVQAALRAWREASPGLGSTKVTYWRGQRIELRQPRRARFRTPAVTPLAVALIYLLMGAGLWLGAARLLLRLATF